MNMSDIVEKERQWLTCGNEMAADFLKVWGIYVHGIDDLIDGDKSGSESMLEVFMTAAFVYTHPYFVQNMPQLRQIAVNCTNAYADTVLWEKAGGWKQNFSDHYRHFGAEMVLAVAGLCGGYMHMRQASPLLRELCWNEHHNEKGEMT
jgi:hypothetical protein